MEKTQRKRKSAGYSTKVPDSLLLMVYMKNIIKVSQIQEGIMKKKISLLLIAMLSLASLAACGEKADAETPQEGGGSVVVYSPHNAEEINPIINEFTERTGIRVDVVAAGTGELLKRVEAESANPLGDVMWGGGAESLDSFKEYFASYTIEDDAKIPDLFKDPDRLWYGFSALPMVIIYNNKLVSAEEAPKSWEDLTDPKWKGKIAFADPAKSGSSYTIMATMLEAFKNDGEDGWKTMKAFIENLDNKILGSSSGTYKGVSDGEYAVGLTLEKAASRYIIAGSDMTIVYPEEGTSAAPDGIALIKGAKNEENAKKFIEFTFSKEVQDLAAKDFSWRSTRTDANNPEGLGSIDDIKLLDYDFKFAAENKDALLEKWKNIVTGQE